MKKHLSTTILFMLLACSASAARAQMATPSARSFGLADAFTARARGFEAPFWNAANLGLSESPGWSVGVAGVNGYIDNNSLSYGQIEDLYGTFLDDDKKTELLNEIRGASGDGMLELNVDLGANVLGFSIWRFAFGVGATGSTKAEVSADVAELVLFGNVGEDGNGRDFDIQGSHADGWGLSGGYLSYAQPFTIPALDHLGMKFSVGGTVKYGMANGLYRVADRGSLLTNDPLTLNVEAEVLYSTEFDAGRIWSADLGAAMEWNSWVFGLSVANLLSSINWNEDAFELTQYVAYAAFDSSSAFDTTLAFSELPLEDQQRIESYLLSANVPTKLRLGAAWEMSRLLTLSADYKELIGGSLRARWDRQLAVGAELLPVAVLPLRLGLATDFNNLAIAGGFGVFAGPVHLDFSVGRWGIGAGDGLAASLSISVWPGMGYP